MPAWFPSSNMSLLVMRLGGSASIACGSKKQGFIFFIEPCHNGGIT